MLDPSYAGLLSESEIALRDGLHRLASADDGAADGAPAWPLVRKLLKDLGMPEL